MSQPKMSKAAAGTRLRINERALRSVLQGIDRDCREGIIVKSAEITDTATAYALTVQALLMLEASPD